MAAQFNMSTYLQGQLVAHIFRTDSFTKPTVLAIALCSGIPTTASTGGTIPELPFANGYARTVLNPLDTNWAAITQVNGSGNTNNSVAITFPAATPGAWPTVSGIAIIDTTAYGSGNMLFFGTLSTPKTPGVSDQFQINVASLNLYFD